MKLFLSLLCVALIFSAPAIAGNNTDMHQGHGAVVDTHEDHEDHDHGEMDHSGAVDVYAPAMETMHEGMMSVEPSGDADVDFVRGMIPHHQGAVDMAKILKEKGKDAELQSLADSIITSQEKEIAMMKNWLKRHGK